MRLKKRFVALLIGFVITISTMPMVSAFNLEAAQAYNKALDSYINGKTTEAITQFKKAISLDPQFTDAYYNLGSIYRYTNQFDLAEEAFQKVLTLKSNDSSVNYDLALIYIQKNDYKRATSYLNLVSDSSERYQDAQTKLSLLKGEMKSIQNNSQKLEKTIVKNLSEDKNVEVTVNKNKQPQPVSKKPEVKEENTKDINKIKKVSKKNKNTHLSKKERKEISKTLISNSFVEQAEPKVKNTEPEKGSKIIENNENKKPKINKYLAKYGQSNTKTEPEIDNEVNEEEIALSYMAIQDTGYDKLTISPKKEMISASNNKKKVIINDKNQRKAIKTYASGFNGPTGIVRDLQGNLYVANYSENKIYKVSTDGSKTLYASSEDINGPIGMAIDNKSGNIFIANYLSNSITKITPEGETFTIATGLNKPYFLYLDNTDSLYVSEQDSNSISVIDLTKGKNR